MNIKSHFQFTNKQRSGIFLLLLTVVSVQCIYVFVDFSDKGSPENALELERFRTEIDSLRQLKIENSKLEIYPFNPNYITDYKGYTLGMSIEEIDRLHKFRATNQWVNSVEDFKQVTEVSDALLSKISPYFKFPEWVTNPKSKAQSSTNDTKPKTYKQKIDLNTATTSQLQQVYGIGEKLSERIINYRNKYDGGFVADAQLLDIYGLEPEVILRIKNDFTVKTPRAIQKYNLNTATRDQLVTIQYIDYEIAKHIIEERTLRNGFETLEDLTKVEDFPIEKIEIIKLYLHL